MENIREKEKSRRDKVVHVVKVSKLIGTTVDTENVPRETFFFLIRFFNCLMLVWTRILIVVFRLLCFSYAICSVCNHCFVQIININLSSSFYCINTYNFNSLTIFLLFRFHCLQKEMFRITQNTCLCYFFFCFSCKTSSKGSQLEIFCFRMGIGCAHLL